MPSATTKTIIFVDVDGVLNVGARDSGGPLLINTGNINAAREVASAEDVQSNDTIVADKLLAVSNHPAGNRERGTLAMMVANDTGVSEVLVARLVELIVSADPRPTVVLTSSWRQVKCAARKEMLRQSIQAKLGREFNWDGVTAECLEVTPEDRLRCIGDYMAEMDLPSKTPVRCLVLDDFFITPFNGWTCGGLLMRDPEDAEQYLLNRCRAPCSVAVKVVHPYQQLLLESGLKVQAAVGLTGKHFEEASDFLQYGEGGSQRPATPLPGRAKMLAAKVFSTIKCRG